MRRNLWLVVVVAPVALLSLVSAGCGGSAQSETGSNSSVAGSSVGAVSGTGTAPTASATGQAKGVRFAECMRANGVPDFPDPDAKGDFAYGVSVSPSVFTKAAEACKSLEPPGALSSKRTPKQQSGVLKFAACIRLHGVKDFPDPVNGEPAIDTTNIPSTDKPGGMTILNAAIAKCRSVSGLAAGGQGG